MGKGYSAPSAEETAEANKETARWNTEMSFVDQYTPYGNYTYSKLPTTQLQKTERYVESYDANGNPVYGTRTWMEDDPDAAPRYRLDVALSDTEKNKLNSLDTIEQGLLDYGGGIIDRAGTAATNGLDLSGVTAVNKDWTGQNGNDLAAQYGLTTGVTDDLSGMRQQAYNSAYDLLTSGYDDRFARQQSDLENKLTSQGLMQGTEAWDRAMTDFDDNRESAYRDAANNAYTQSLAEQNQMFSEALSNANLGNTAISNAYGQAQDISALESQLRAQELEEQSWINNYDLNQLNALISGTQVTSPSFTSVGTSSAAQQPYSQGSSGNSWISDLLGLGGSLGSALLLG